MSLYIIDMTIEELFNNNVINARLYNICRYEKIESVNDLRDYYSAHKTFKMLPKCGPKLSRKLIEICEMSDDEIKEKISNYKAPCTKSTIQKNKTNDYRPNSIRGIAVTYLEQTDKPAHISTIWKHISKHHPRTTPEKIRINLKSIKDGRFIFFEGGFIGLASKSSLYKKLDFTDNKRLVKKTWQERFDELLQFVEKEKRLPWASASTAIEKRLYQWFNRQSNFLKKGVLEADKAKLIKEIKDKNFKVSTAEKVKLFENYDELIEFVSTNNRLPLKSVKEESQLNYFFKHQRIIFIRDELKDQEKEKFMEVLRMVDGVK